MCRRKPEASAFAWCALVCAVLAVACNARRAPEPQRTPTTAPSSPATAAPAPTPAGSSGSASAGEAPTLSLEYLEITTGSVHGNDAAPLVVALHGLGDSPQGFVGLFASFAADARILLPHSRTRYSDGFAWFPPGLGTSDPGAPALAEAASSVAAFIAEAVAKRPTKGRPIVVGFSQGGALTFTVAVTHPERVGAAFPIGGWLPRPLWPEARANDASPLIAFHGTADTRVPIASARAAVGHLRELGVPASLREFEGVGHGISPLEHEAILTALADACDTERTRGSSRN